MSIMGNTLIIKRHARPATWVINLLKAPFRSANSSSLIAKSINTGVFSLILYFPVKLVILAIYFYLKMMTL